MIECCTIVIIDWTWRNISEAHCKYYNELMWPKRFADCISLEEAIEMMEKQGLNALDRGGDMGVK